MFHGLSLPPSLPPSIVSMDGLVVVVVGSFGQSILHQCSHESVQTMISTPGAHGMRWVWPELLASKGQHYVFYYSVQDKPVHSVTKSTLSGGGVM